MLSPRSLVRIAGLTLADSRSVSLPTPRRIADENRCPKWGLRPPFRLRSGWRLRSGAVRAFLKIAIGGPNVAALRANLCRSSVPPVAI